MLRRTSLALGLLGLVLTAPLRGTSPPGPLVIVGLDGFRADYLEWAEARSIAALGARGVRSDGLIPPFPSKTFPSFTTIATGLRPARHGIVGNTMDAPGVPGRFALADHAVRSDPRWWLGEPVWNTAGRQSRRAFGLFWPGDDVAIDGRRPDEWSTYDESVPDDARIDRVLAGLARPPAARPDLVMLYFSLVDTAAHAHGPLAPETRAAVARADALVSRLLAGIAQAGLADTATVVLVSDHGLAETHPDRVIELDALIDPTTADVLETGPMLRIQPRPGGPDASALLGRLRGAHPRLAVYAREDVPARYHYAGSDRIPPVIGVADEGWLVMTRAARERWVAGGGRPRGDHGYDPAVPAMHGLFVGAGPALGLGVRVGAFDSVHLYALFCTLLGVAPAPHDGDPAVTRPLLRAVP